MIEEMAQRMRANVKNLKDFWQAKAKKKTEEGRKKK